MPLKTILVTTVWAGLCVAGLAACGVEREVEEETPFGETSDGSGASAQGEAAEDGIENADAYIFQCGETPVAIAFRDVEQMEMRIGEETFLMFRSVSASGARFQAADDPDTVFFTQGTSATLTLAGEEYPECSMVREPIETAQAGDEAMQLTSGEWVVEDLNGAGVIDMARATLVFGTDGRLSGLGTCNNYSASYEATESGEGAGSLSVGPTMSTRKACPEALMNQENTFLNTLGAVDTYEITADGALLLQGDGYVITARQ